MSDTYSTPKPSPKSGGYCIPKAPPAGHKTGSASQKRAPAQKTSRAADHSAPKHK